ncbi:hypothetical protein ACMG4P_04850 [Pseudovibrio denitrificans]|uniref:hypothetical protein n=1 Tax=Pseudovibrio denitrificans TaxID=258256 RepID=UPI0039BFC921
MADTETTRSDHTSSEPRRLSKAALAKKYAAIIAFTIGGHALWTLYQQFSGPLSALQLVMVVGSLIAIGLGAWLWPNKLTIINLIATVALVNVGMTIVFIAFGGAIGFLISSGIIGVWAAEPVTLFGLVIGCIIALMAINIIRTP